MELIFATHNQHKLHEVQKMLPEITLKSLSEIGFHKEIKETGHTFKANASIKSKTIYNECGLNVFSDDSGLVIPALGGAPGIYSARYAGTGNNKDNLNKVLKNLEGVSNREAYFICVISLILNGKEYLFEGKCEGNILNTTTGDKGFGYDPIFCPNGYDKSFAQLPPEVKNKISHRAVAIQQLKDFLQDTLTL